MAYLAIGAIFQDEARYLGEWLAFHRLMGVEHFYLYNNNSTDGFADVLAPWIAKGFVSLYHWPMEYKLGAQKQAYVDCLKHARGNAHWVAFIDIDEFLFGPDGSSLPKILTHFEDYPGLVVHWQVFGSCSEERGTEGLVIQRFTYRAHRNWVRNRRVKSIVQPAYVKEVLSAHHFTYINNLTAVNERRVPVRVRSRPKLLRKLLRRYAWFLGSLMQRIDPYKGTYHETSDCPCDVLRLHHYILKSKEEFALKAARRKLKWASYAPQDHVYRMFFWYHDRNEVKDNILVELLPALQASMAED